MVLDGTGSVYDNTGWYLVSKVGTFVCCFILCWCLATSCVFVVVSICVFVVLSHFLVPFLVSLCLFVLSYFLDLFLVSLCFFVLSHFLVLFAVSLFICCSPISWCYAA